MRCREPRAKSKGGTKPMGSFGDKLFVFPQNPQIEPLPHFNAVFGDKVTRKQLKVK